MKLRIYDPIVLAIDLRHRRLGYAAFRGRHVLLDWGNRVYRAVGDVEKLLAGKRLSKLIDEIKPHAIILKKERWERGHTDHHMGNVVEAVQGVAAIRSAHAVRRRGPGRLVLHQPPRRQRRRHRLHVR